MGTSTLDFWQIHSSFYQVLPAFDKFPLLSLMLLYLLLQHVGNTLVRGWEEVVGEHDLLYVSQTRVMVNSRVQVEQNWQIDLLLGIQKLVFKAEALNFVEV